MRILILAVTLWAMLASSPGPAVVNAQSPSPTVIGEGDTRSEGEGAGLVGAPVLVAAGVVLLGLAAAGATLVYLRLVRED
ncbi:MAG TPA: hypothetical protein VGQ47_03095 [Candidatus Limnocylindrales bacterium]|jgi:hypothetical protein|nr:hypothetical protein [Candidatus Limnocylindrales bacterium]